MLLWAVILAATGPLPSSSDRLAVMQERRILLAQRKEKIQRILAAVRASDEAGLKREGVLGVPYFLGQKAPRPPVAPPPSAFGWKSLSKMDGCTASSPSGTGIDWISINWECPDNSVLPWSSTSTAFKFEGMAISEIRTVPGPPSIRVVK
jgi:hypothetical protein